MELLPGAVRRNVFQNGARPAISDHWIGRANFHNGGRIEMTHSPPHIGILPGVGLRPGIAHTYRTGPRFEHIDFRTILNWT
jgi:hypothetical protein